MKHMKVLVRTDRSIFAAKVQSKGVFWYVPDENELLSFPYNPDEYTSALSKNGLSYTHKKL